MTAHAAARRRSGNKSTPSSARAGARGRRSPRRQQEEKHEAGGQRALRGEDGAEEVLGASLGIELALDLDLDLDLEAATQDGAERKDGQRGTQWRGERKEEREAEKTGGKQEDEGVEEKDEKKSYGGGGGGASYSDERLSLARTLCERRLRAEQVWPEHKESTAEALQRYVDEVSKEGPTSETKEAKLLRAHFRMAKEGAEEQGTVVADYLLCYETEESTERMREHREVEGLDDQAWWAQDDRQEEASVVAADPGASATQESTWQEEACFVAVDTGAPAKQ